LKKIIDKELKNGTKLPLVEDFYSIQGEGYHTGKAAYFVRLGGCDIGCSWCDTKFSWDPKLHPLISADVIVERAKSFEAKSIVVTGGEPLLYNLDYLCSELKKYQIKTFVETSGTHTFTGNWNWVCLSPKKQSPPLSEAYNKASELKVIIHDKGDFEWAEENALKVRNSCKLYLQPEWSIYQKIKSKVIQYVKDHPKWNISLQAHKFMGIP